MLASFLRYNSTLNLTVYKFRQGVDISGKLASGEEEHFFRKVAGMSIIAVGGLRSQ